MFWAYEGADDVGADEAYEADGACEDDGDGGEDSCAGELGDSCAADVEADAFGFVDGEGAGVV